MPGNVVSFATDLDKNNYKFSAFKKLVIKSLFFTIQFKLHVFNISSLSDNLQDIIRIISDNIQNIERLESIIQTIENLFYKIDEINLDRESAVILALKYIGGV